VDGVEQDGRRRRRLRNTETMVRRTLELLCTEPVDLTAATIAERSGMSMRSLFRHFESVDVLVLAAAAEFYASRQRSLAFPGPPSTTPLPERIEPLVTRRVAMYADGSTTLRAFERMTARYPGLRELITADALTTISFISGLFAPELAAMPEPIARVSLGSLDTCTSFDLWNRLHTVHHFDDDTIADIMRASCAACVGIDPTVFDLVRIGPDRRAAQACFVALVATAGRANSNPFAIRMAPLAESAQATARVVLPSAAKIATHEPSLAHTPSAPTPTVTSPRCIRIERWSSAPTAAATMPPPASASAAR
jgi:AcrR family transcriptional regulator